MKCPVSVCKETSPNNSPPANKLCFKYNYISSHDEGESRIWLELWDVSDF